MLRVLVLDCGSVTNPDATTDLPTLAAAMGVPPERAAKGMSAAWREARSNADMDAACFWRRALDVAGAELPFDDAAIERCEQCVAMTLRRTFPDTLQTAARLKAHGVVIGIISNHITSPPWFQNCAIAAGLYELASHPSLVVVSQEVGVAKPAAQIYQIFFDRLLQQIDSSLRPEELLFVDDKEANVAAARMLGWKGLIFNAMTSTPGALASALADLGMSLPGS